jgi:hypothetical protein
MIMAMYSFKAIKKEVKRYMLGTDSHLGVISNAPLVFKSRYYDKITDMEKQKLVNKALLDILSSHFALATKKLRVYAAYIAGDIRLMEARPYVEKMLNEKRIVHSSLLILLERAIEFFHIHYEFSRDDMARIIKWRIMGRYRSGFDGGEAVYDLKETFYDRIADERKKAIARDAIMHILINKSQIKLFKILILAGVAFAASRIGMDEARPIIEEMALDPSIQKNRPWASLIQNAIKNYEERDVK